MQKQTRRLILVTFMVLITVWVSACCTATSQPVYLLRHAEKASSGSDPNLTPAGQARAQELLRILGNVPVNAIYSTNTNRTRQTAQPLATAKNLAIQIYADASIANTILSGSANQIAVIVGHSDTVPELITAFGATPPYTLIPGNEFDNLFLLIVKEISFLGTYHRTTKVLHMKYGFKSD